MIIECQKHGKVEAEPNLNYDVYCPFCTKEITFEVIQSLLQCVKEDKSNLTPEEKQAIKATGEELISGVQMVQQPDGSLIPKFVYTTTVARVK